MTYIYKKRLRKTGRSIQGSGKYFQNLSGLAKWFKENAKKVREKKEQEKKKALSKKAISLTRT